MAEPVEGAALGAVIAFDGASLSYADRLILKDIRLDVRAGEVVSVIGASGCGKTTLLRLAAGLVHPSSGRVLYQGQPIEHPRRDVAVVFQDYANALLPWRSASGNVALALEARHMPRAERDAIVAELLHSMGLGAHADSRPAQMSGGMQQRLQIARCLAQDPRVLLMDEPFGALDALTRQSLQDEVLKIVVKRRSTVLFITHDLEEAIYLSDRIIGLKPNPGHVAEIFEVDLPRPRDQLTSREHPDFLRLRRQLHHFIQEKGPV